MADSPERSSKTEKPTERRLEEARKKGNLPQSRDVTAVLLVGALTGVLATWGGTISQTLIGLLATAFDVSQPGDISTADELVAYATNYVSSAMLWVSPLFGVMVVAVIAAPIAQDGFVFSGERLRPQLQRVSPIAGFKRLFSTSAMVEIVKGSTKIVVIAAVTMAAVGPVTGDLNPLFHSDARGLAAATGNSIVDILTNVAVAMLIIAVLDVGWQRFAWWRNLFMTRQELREEFRQGEGNPEVKGRIKALRRERASRRMMAAVPEATVVITNPTHFAVALVYDRTVMRAPRCVAKGQDAIAMRIREVAQSSDVPIVENKPLARALYSVVEIDEEVPPEHYKAVAEIVSYILSMRRSVA